VEETIVETYSIHYLIQQITIIIVNIHLLFGVAPLTCFGLYRNVIYKGMR